MGLAEGEMKPSSGFAIYQLEAGKIYDVGRGQGEQEKREK